MSRIKIQLYLVTLSILIFSLIPIDIHSQNKDDNSKIRVGFYQYSPYYFINEDGNPDGYYNDLLNLISKEIGIDYQYIYCDVNKATDKLKNGEVDLLFGINQTSSRMSDFVYSDYYIAIERYAIYTNKDICFGQLEALNGLKFGYIKNEANNEWILSLLKSKNINVNLVEARSYEELSNLLISGAIDVTVSSTKTPILSGYKKIFEYTAGPVYIVAKKGDEELIKKVNQVYEKYAEKKINPITNLKEKYFNKYTQQIKKNLIINLVLVLLIMGIVGFILYNENMPKLRLIKKQNQIRAYIQENNYLLHYQPIVNPKTNKIKGFEALLRMKLEDKILMPNYFIKDIEDSNMMFEISLWIIKKAINDYNIIKSYEIVRDNNFYISVNISFKEIENNEFINEVKEIAQDLDVKPNTICLEIIEKFGIKDLNKIQEAIKELKKCGFIVAIDDFGVEYSNLDILEKLDYSIIKLDKYFIDDIENSLIRKEIVKFLSNICKFSDKIIVSEGVERIEQRDIIKEIDNDRLYIQGYLYSKPLDIRELRKFNID